MTKLITNSKGSQGVKRTTVNYEAASDTLAAHLQGIDEALAGGEVSGHFIPEIEYVANLQASSNTSFTNRGYWVKVGNVISGTVMLEMKIINGSIESRFRIKKLNHEAANHLGIVTCSRFRDYYSTPFIYDLFQMSAGADYFEILITTKAGQNNDNIFGSISFMYDLLP